MQLNSGGQTTSVRHTRQRPNSNLHQQASSPTKLPAADDDKDNTISNQQTMMGYLTLMNTDYAYRLRTKALFEPGQPTVCFDVFVVENINRLKEYRL